VLLNSKRIGHGFALVKYPSVLKIVKEKQIGIEVNPISNQVLKLVDDIRNHPASILFSDDYPVIISRCDKTNKKFRKFNICTNLNIFYF
jgi:adenosine deaminase CECR1